MAMSEKSRQRKIAYDTERTAKVSTLIAIRLQNTADKEIIDYINSQPNKAEFLRNLVREDMKKNGK